MIEITSFTKWCEPGTKPQYVWMDDGFPAFHVVIKNHLGQYGVFFPAISLDDIKHIQITLEPHDEK